MRKGTCSRNQALCPAVAQNYGMEDAQTRSVERLLQMTMTSPAGYRRKLPHVIKIATSSSASASKTVFLHRAFSRPSVQHPVTAKPKLLTVHYFEFGSLSSHWSACHSPFPEGAVTLCRCLSNANGVVSGEVWARYCCGRFVPVAHSPYYIRHVVQ